MRKGFLFLAAGALLGAATLGAAGAQEAPGAIEGVISRQMEAFKADDLATAFSFAAPGIRTLFGDPMDFGAMVRQGYPMVWRPADIRFLEARPIAGGVVQTVLVRDGAGAFHTLEYLMVEGAEGWQIAGVRLLEAPDVGA